MKLFIFKLLQNGKPCFAAIDSEGTMPEIRVYTKSIPVELMMNNPVIVNISLLDAKIETSHLTTMHYKAIMALHENYLDEQAGIDCDMHYLAFAMSVSRPDTMIMSLQRNAEWGTSVDAGSLFVIKSIESAKTHRAKFNDENCVGGRSDGGAIIFKNGYIVGSLSFNSRLQNTTGFGGRENKFVDAFVEPDTTISLVDFYSK